MERYTETILNKQGKPVAGAVVTVTTYPDNEPATIYAADGGQAVESVSSDENGRFAFYAADGHYNLSIVGKHIDPFTITDVVLNDPNDDASSVVVGGIAARVDALEARASEVVSVKDSRFAGGAKGNGVTDDTAAIQAAIEFVSVSGGGAVYLPEGNYLVGTSSLNETFSNFGVPVPASDCAVVLRKGVSLVGAGRARCKISTSLTTKIIIAMVAPEGNMLTGFELAGAYNMGSPGAGHGVFVLATAGDADVSCKNLLFRDLYIHNVASYGIGLQNGNPQSVRIESVDIENTGADGLDLKARSDSATEPSGNFVANVRVRNHGLRTDGAAGVDIRGLWHASGVTVTDYGSNPALSYVGIRFRTKPPATDAYNRAAARSSLTGFYIRAGDYAGGGTVDGVVSGSDDVHISDGVVQGCTNGVLLNGNANGNASRNVVTGVTAVDSRLYGFQVAPGCSNSLLVSCVSVSSATAGFRNAGAGTMLSGCRASGETTPKSTATASAADEITTGCDFGPEFGIAMYSAATGRVNLDAKGPSANIDIALGPKGAGLVRFGSHSVSADAAITGYVTIKDAAGTQRKLAVIA